MPAYVRKSKAEWQPSITSSEVTGRLHRVRMETRHPPRTRSCDERNRLHDTVSLFAIMTEISLVFGRNALPSSRPAIPFKGTNVTGHPISANDAPENTTAWCRWS